MFSFLIYPNCSLEHIGTKTAVQIRSHAQKFFSKVLNPDVAVLNLAAITVHPHYYTVTCACTMIFCKSLHWATRFLSPISHAELLTVQVVREPGASNTIEIPPPRPKRKPLHPYPRKCADSNATVPNPAMGQTDNAPISSPSGSDQENGSPVSVLSAMQSDAFGSSVSNPSTGCTSPVSSDEGNTVPAMVNVEENLLTQQQIEDVQSHQVMKHLSYASSSFFQMG